MSHARPPHDAVRCAPGPGPAVRRVRRPAVAVVVAAVVVGLGPVVPASASTVGAASAAAKEREVLRCVNAERTKRGLVALRRSSPLTKAARSHARRMRTKRFFSHEDPAGDGPRERVRRRTKRFRTIGENIAAGNAGARHYWVQVLAR